MSEMREGKESGRHLHLSPGGYSAGTLPYLRHLSDSMSEPIDLLSDPFSPLC